MDDRKRSVMNDPRAAASAPPAPDPTAYHKGQGFTGMEAFWNYAYWQTLAINPFDSVGHLLRGLFILGSPCANYQTGAGCSGAGHFSPGRLYTVGATSVDSLATIRRASLTAALCATLMA